MKQETKDKISKSLMGHPMAEKAKEKLKPFKAGHTPWNKGKSWPKEMRDRISATNKRRGIRPTKRDVFKKGEAHPLWRGGVTPLNKAIRRSLEYRLWRAAVFARDNFTCVWCKIRGGELHADHIKPFAFFPELRFAIDNGRTLCVSCHKKTDTYGEKCKKKYKKLTI